MHPANTPSAACCWRNPPDRMMRTSRSSPPSTNEPCST